MLSYWITLLSYDLNSDIVYYGGFPTFPARIVVFLPPTALMFPGFRPESPRNLFMLRELRDLILPTSGHNSYRLIRSRIKFFSHAAS